MLPMVDKRFIEYFDRWKSKGYSESQIKSFLLKQGHLPAIVDEAANISRITYTQPIFVNDPDPSDNTVSAINTVDVSRRAANYRRTLTVLIVFSVVACIIIVACFIADKNLNFLS